VFDHFDAAQKKREQASRARRLSLAAGNERYFDVLRALADALEAEAKAPELRSRARARQRLVRPGDAEDSNDPPA